MQNVEDLSGSEKKVKNTKNFKLRYSPIKSAKWLWRFRRNTLEDAIGTRHPPTKKGRRPRISPHAGFRLPPHTIREGTGQGEIEVETAKTARQIIQRMSILHPHTHGGRMPNCLIKRELKTDALTTRPTRRRF